MAVETASRLLVIPHVSHADWRNSRRSQWAMDYEAGSTNRDVGGAYAGPKSTRVGATQTQAGEGEDTAALWVGIFPRKLVLRTAGHLTHHPTSRP